MPGRKVVLQASQNPPAVDIAKEYIQRYGGRLILLDQRTSAHTERRDQPSEPFFARGFEQKTSERQVIFDDKKHAVARLNNVSIVARFIDRRCRAGFGHKV